MVAASLAQIYRKLLSRFGPQHWWPARTPFEMIVGAILTQNTAWTNVEKAIGNLKKRRLLRVRAMVGVSRQTLAQAIRPAGYYNVKTDRLKHFVRHLNGRYGGSLAKMLAKNTDGLRRELLSIKGIGPETADSILLYAGQKPVFVVDAYTRRIFSRVGLFEDHLSYEAIQNFFMKHMRQDTAIYNQYHALIVRLAKENCRIAPRCFDCCIKMNCTCGTRASVYGRKDFFESSG